MVSTRPSIVLCTYLLTHALLWITLAMWMYATPPGDNIEQFNWSHSLEWGYYKHPPLVTWLLYFVLKIPGSGLATTYVLGYACVVLALYLMWRVCVLLQDQRSAMLSVLIGSCIYYFSVRGHLFNHNTVMLPVLVAAALAFMHVTRSGSWSAWIAMGLALGIGTLVKYQMVLFGFVFVVGFFVLGTWKQRGFWLRSMASFAVFSVVVFPHIAWLFENDFRSFKYADQWLGAALGPAERIRVTLGFLAQQLSRLLPALLALSLAIWLAGRTLFRALPATPSRAVRRDDNIITVLFAAGPLTLMALLCPLFGVHLQNQWGTPALMLAIPAIGAVASKLKYRLPDLRAALTAVCLIQFGSLVAAAFGTLYNGNIGHHSGFQSDALAASALAVWQRAVPNSGPSVVIGPDWEAGAIAAHLPGRPAVMMYGRPENAPWISRERVESCGALVVWPGANLLDPPALPWQLMERMTNRTIVSARPKYSQSDTLLEISVAVIPPAGDCK